LIPNIGNKYLKAADIVNSFLAESNPIKTMSRRKNAATLFLTLADYLFIIAANSRAMPDHGLKSLFLRSLRQAAGIFDRNESGPFYDSLAFAVQHPH
jgi:hypothetical protein